MPDKRRISAFCFTTFFFAAAALRSVAEQPDYSPPPTQRQLPRAMRSEMKERPRITVGRSSADLIGSDNRVLQAAVDYLANLGGGDVEIGPGDYLMRDSLHLRSGVTVRGRGGDTRLCKAPAAVSPLALDGDFGEEQITLQDPQISRSGTVWPYGIVEPAVFILRWLASLDETRTRWRSAGHQFRLVV